MDFLSDSQQGKAATINEGLRACSMAATLANRGATTAGLVWGYYGGCFTLADGTIISIADGTLTMTASSSNYVELNLTTGALVVNTTGWTGDNLMAVALIVAGADTITSSTDYRAQSYSGWVNWTALASARGGKASGFPLLDSSRLLQLPNGAGTYTGTLGHSATAARAWTMQDASGTVPLLESAQTFSGALTFTGGLFQKNLQPYANAVGQVADYNIQYYHASLDGYWLLATVPVLSGSYISTILFDVSISSPITGAPELFTVFAQFSSSSTAYRILSNFKGVSNPTGYIGIYAYKNSDNTYSIYLKTRAGSSLITSISARQSGKASAATLLHPASVTSTTTAPSGGTVELDTSSGGISAAEIISTTTGATFKGVLSNSAGVGYTTGAGGTATQTTSRTTSVPINKASGAITLVSAAGSTAWQTFTVTNSVVAATDTISVSQKSGTDKYMIHVTAVNTGSFNITFATTGGTTTEQPVFNFNVIKGASA